MAVLYAGIGVCTNMRQHPDIILYEYVQIDFPPIPP